MIATITGYLGTNGQGHTCSSSGGSRSNDMCWARATPHLTIPHCVTTGTNGRRRTPKTCGQVTRRLPDTKHMSVHSAENHCSTTKHCIWTILNHAIRVATTAMPTSDWYTSTAINNDIAGIQRQHMRYYARDVCGLLELLAVKVARAVLRGGRWRRHHPLTRPPRAELRQPAAARRLSHLATITTRALHRRRRSLAPAL